MAPQGIEIARLDHLGIVAGLCREIGIVDYLDARDEHMHERVSVGTATVAMLLKGLGFANRRLYLVSQFFKTKPVAHLLGPGITAEDLNDECLGRTLDWLYAHDPTALFAGLPPRPVACFATRRRNFMWTRPPLQSAVPTSPRKGIWMPKRSPSPTATRATTGRISSSGCWRW